MAWSASNIKHLDNAMSANQDVLLGTTLNAMLFGNQGAHIVTSAEDNASAIALDVSASSITGWIVSITAQGSPVAIDTPKVYGQGGSVLRISGSALVAGQVVTYTVF